MIRPCLISIALLATPVSADVTEAVEAHVLPGYATLVEATARLSETLESTCSGPEVTQAYHTAYDAWLGISHIQFGPIEARGLTLSFAFWPDPKNQTDKALRKLAAAEDPVVNDSDAYAAVSVAAQGFLALERLLYAPPVEGDYACQLTRAIAKRAALNAADLSADWNAGFVEELRSPNAQNASIRSDDEAKRALYTSLATALQFLYDQRLGRPLGSFEKPRPKRAEARRSERSQRNIELSLRALRDLSARLADAPTPRTDRAFDVAFSRLEGIDDPALAGVVDPGKRFKIEALRQDIRIIQQTVAAEIGAELGVGTGFNSLDGD